MLHFIPILEESIRTTVCPDRRDGRLLQERLVAYAAGKAHGGMETGNAQESLVKVHPFQLVDRLEAKDALAAAVQSSARQLTTGLESLDNSTAQFKPVV